MTDNICGADMGDGIICQRPLVKRSDPLAWECGWGHRWTPTLRDGVQCRQRRPDAGARTITWNTDRPDEIQPMPVPTPLHSAPVPDELAAVATEAGYELVMPFVCCSSNEGPYDDAAFTAGVQFGVLHHRLRQHPRAEIREYVATPLVPQLDLLAMHHGYTLTSEPWDEHPDDWTLVTFRLAETDERAA